MYAQLLRKLSRRPSGVPTVKAHTLPAPVGGWNARDSLSAMKPEDAIVLDNVIPGMGRVYVRPGFEAWTTGLGSYVESLMEFAPPNGSNKLLAATPTALYDATAAGIAGAALASGLTNGHWQHTMFAATGGNFLCLVNGADHYRTWDGTTLTDRDAAVTGISGGAANTTEWSGVAVHASRLWFIQKDALDLWYLPTASITGAAAKLPLGPLCAKGGSLVAVGTWTTDGGDGSNDRLVAVTDKGQVVVYQGSDPATAASWSLVGVFNIAEPIGPRCLIKVGGDVGVITSRGVALLSQLIGVNVSGQKKVTITNKIGDAFLAAYATAGGNSGWQVIEFPAQSLVIVNVPLTERVMSHQYVINVETGGWCRFTGVNALCWSLLGDKLYFGGADGKTYRFGDATSDDGAAINWIIQTAYNKFGTPASKIVKMVRAFLRATEGYAPGIEVKTDYDTAKPKDVAPTFGGTVGATWDLTDWDTGDWAGRPVKTRRWQGARGEGRAISVVLAGSCAEVLFEFNEIDVAYEAGGLL